MSDERTAVRTIGRYQVLGELGRGAMGIVYRGFDPVIGRTVALKTISFTAEHAESLALRTRLYREAAAAGTLVHPNIVTVYDIVEDGASTAVAMELVEGQTLAALISRTGPLPFDQAIRIFEQVCSALDYAGSKGIVHRDIKPANILLTPEGHPKIMDFGIARVALAGVTQTSTIMGSPSYMSPEQVRGLPLDPRSDLFSAAVVFYEMLSGQRPFVGDDVATTMYRIVSGAPLPIEQFVPTMQPAVSRVIEWALSKDLADRPQTGRDLVDALKREAGSDAGSAAVYAPPIALSDGAPVEYTGRGTFQPELAAAGDVRTARRSPLLVAGVLGSGLLFIATVAAIVVMRSGGSAQLPIGGGGAPAGMAVSAGEPLAPEPAPAAVQRAPETRRTTVEPAGRPSSNRPMEAARPAAATSPVSERPAPSGAPAVAATTPIAHPPLRSATVVTAGPVAPLPKVAAAPPAAAPLSAAPLLPPAPSTTATPSAANRAAAPTVAVAPVGTGEAIVQIEFEGAAYPVTLFAGETRLGRVETANGSVTVEPGSARLRAVSEPLFLDTLLPPVTLRAGERRSIAVPGLCSAAFGMKGEDYTGVRLLIDGRQVPGPYPAQVARIAAGTHRIVYRWASGPAAGREVSDNITLLAGGHFLVRAALDNDKLVVQQLR